jgi:hypothetical protein
MEGDQPGGKWFEGWRPGSVVRVFADGPPEGGFAEAGRGPRLGGPEFGTGQGLGAAPAGLFREALMNDPESLLPGTVIKAFGDVEDIPEAAFGPAAGEQGAAPSLLFEEKAKEDPGSLLPGSVFRIY